MKPVNFSYIPFVVIALFIIAGLTIVKLSKTNDSPAEQFVESVLKTQGVDIDFSPDED